LALKGGRAELCARLFADSSRDGVYSHGLNRFPRFVEMIKRDLPSIDKEGIAARVTNQIIGYVHDAKASGGQRVRYPGERTMEIRNQNLAEGVPVEAHIWQSLQDM